MPRETVINPPLHGAARTLATGMPSPQTQTVGDVAQGINWIDRQAFLFQDRGTYANFGVPPAGTGWDLYRGRVAFKQTGSGTSGGFYTTGSDFAIYFPQNGPNAIGGDFQDDLLCWRVLAVLAFDGSSLGSGDIGLEVGAAMSTNYNIITALSPGFRLAPTAAGQISFQVRQNGGGGLTVNQVVANVDVNDWHIYEMRFIGATAKQDAIVKAYVDGVQLASQSWGAGTLLPSWGNGASLGYGIGIGNRGAAATYVAKMGLQVSAAATEPGLL